MQNITNTKMLPYVQAFKELGLNLTPSGIWKLNLTDNCSKMKVDVNRLDHLSWNNYPKDNMGRIFLNKEYLVVDIDGMLDSITDSEIILTNGMRLPITFYTTTTCTSKIHLYYSSPKYPVPNRLVKKIAPSIDVFSGGVIFEGHLAKAEIHKHDVVAMPEEHPFIQQLYMYASKFATSSAELIPLSKITTATAAKEFLKEDFIEQQKGVRNRILREIIPYAYHPEKGTRPDISKTLPLDYTFFNDTATKLMGVAELSTEDVYNVITKMVQMLGGDPKHDSLLDKNIFATLPNRDAILLHDPDEAKPFDELVADQYSNVAVFKTSQLGIKKAELVYVRVDKMTHEVLEFNDIVYASPTMIQSLVPERAVTNEHGIPVSWDTNVPIVELINDPYEEQITYNDRHPVLNLYHPTIYVKNVESKALIADNLIMRAAESVIHPDYLDMYLLWLAYVVFHDTNVTVYPFMAAPKRSGAGTGKSLFTIKVPSKILGKAAQALSTKDFENQWADSFVGKRLISIEDLERLSPAAMNMLMDRVKQLDAGGYKSMNYKSGAICSQILKVSLSISSNYEPYVDSSNRRLWALKPAHIEKVTSPLSKVDAAQIDKMMKSSEYSLEIQEFTNHLRYLYDTTELTDELHYNLFDTAVVTHTRKDWEVNGGSFSTRVVALLDDPEELLGLFRDEPAHTDVPLPSLKELFTYLILVWREDMEKVGLSWKWYRYLLAHIQDSDSHILTKGKQSVYDSLGLSSDEVTANTMGTTYKEPDHNLIAYELHNLPAAGPKALHMSKQSIKLYTQFIEGITTEEGISGL